MSDPQKVAQQRVTGLLTHPDYGTRVRYERLYNHSALFRSSIQTLAGMLPEWVEGLAQRAERDEARFQVAQKIIMEGKLFPDAED